MMAINTLHAIRIIKSPEAVSCIEINDLDDAAL